MSTAFHSIAADALAALPCLSWPRGIPYDRFLVVQGFPDDGMSGCSVVASAPTYTLARTLALLVRWRDFRTCLGINARSGREPMPSTIEIWRVDA